MAGNLRMIHGLYFVDILLILFRYIIHLFIIVESSMNFRKEHENHQPSCAFVKLQKQDECLWTVYELFELIKAYNLKECVSLIHF